MNFRPAIEQLSRRLPAPGEFQLTEALFLRLLALIYAVSFASFWPQIVGLVGSRGIAPAYQLLNAIHQQSGSRIYFEMPTLFWLGISDAALVAFCAIGCLAGLVMATGFFTRSSATICWILYLSIAAVGQPFSNFQWDALLLESGLLALFAGAPLLVWAYRFLLFRLMLESGLVKLISHDPNWHNLHALRFHFLTQPLPNPIAWYAFYLPGWILDSMTAATLAIELIAPFLLFAPKRLRYIGLAFLALLQAAILLTGNYAFFNFLTLALCLWGLNDQALAPVARCFRRGPKTLQNRILRALSTAALLALMGLGAVTLINIPLPGFDRPVSKILAITGPIEIVNTYGLFAVMTTTRPEIIMEGSNDQLHWTEYAFRYKPGNLHRRLPWVAPYQPRLDWQMWFAALGSYQENTWVGGLIYRLLTGEPSVANLMEPSPFPKPPRFIRAMLYDYQFTTQQERSRTGNIWRRTLQGVWFGPVALKNP
ncbi:MAG: lipase maturation factor family protein [Acidobacteriota bacterium]|nr:lipase maturation factor family protein [Acidobacteriota bacterium]